MHLDATILTFFLTINWWNDVHGRVNSKFCSYWAAYGIPVWQTTRKKWRYDFKPTKEVPSYHNGIYRLTLSPDHMYWWLLIFAIPLPAEDTCKRIKQCEGMKGMFGMFVRWEDTHYSEDRYSVNHYSYIAKTAFLRNRRWGGCMYVLQMFFFRSPQKYRSRERLNGFSWNFYQMIAGKMEFASPYQNGG